MVCSLVGWFLESGTSECSAIEISHVISPTAWQNQARSRLRSSFLTQSVMV